nr:MAG TPA: hypothetical protein [Caudoviricetes sp.]
MIFLNLVAVLSFFILLCRLSSYKYSTYLTKVQYEKQ